MMKFINMTLFSLFLVTSTLSAQSDVPSILLKDLDGKEVDLQSFATNGKITILSFWATWCSPCKKELDAIAEMYPDWREAYDVELIAITVDDARALPKVRPIVESKGWEYYILSDVNGDCMRMLNFQSVPQTMVIDATGKIVYNHPGYAPGDEYELEDKLKALSGK